MADEARHLYQMVEETHRVVKQRESELQRLLEASQKMARKRFLKLQNQRHEIARLREENEELRRRLNG